MPRAVDGWKYCPRCHRWLSINHYCKSRSRSDGLATYCRECKSEIDRESREIRPASRTIYNIFGFIDDWPNLTTKELAVKYHIIENDVNTIASFLRKKGHDLPYKTHTYDHDEFAWWAQWMNTKQLMEAFGLSKSGVTIRKTRLRRLGHTFPTDNHHLIGNQSKKGKTTGPKWDRARFWKRYNNTSVAWAAKLEGISYSAAANRATQCRKEGWK